MSGSCSVARSNTWENEPQGLRLLEEGTWGAAAGLQCDFYSTCHGTFPCLTKTSECKVTRSTATCQANIITWYRCKTEFCCLSKTLASRKGGKHQIRNKLQYHNNQHRRLEQCTLTDDVEGLLNELIMPY